MTMNLRMEINTREIRAEKIGALDQWAQDSLFPDLFYLTEKQPPILFKLLSVEDSVSRGQR